jgi:hypothetical protein
MAQMSLSSSGNSQQQKQQQRQQLQGERKTDDERAGNGLSQQSSGSGRGGSASATAVMPTVAHAVARLDEAHMFQLHPLVSVAHQRVEAHSQRALKRRKGSSKLNETKVGRARLISHEAK